MQHTDYTAFELIASLKVGDKVKVTADGREYVMYVSREPRRSDGAFGSRGSLHVTVTFGPGRYAREVSADALVMGLAGLEKIGD